MDSSGLPLGDRIVAGGLFRASGYGNLVMHIETDRGTDRSMKHRSLALNPKLKPCILAQEEENGSRSKQQAEYGCRSDTLGGRV